MSFFGKITPIFIVALMGGFIMTVSEPAFSEEAETIQKHAQEEIRQNQNPEEIQEDVYPAKQTDKQNGFVKSGASWIYYVDGKESGNTEDIVHGTINGVSGWYYIKNSAAVLNYTGVKNNAHGWWYVKNGKVDFSYNGFAQNENGWWYCENGKVTFSKSEVTHGVVNGISGWWNVKGSNVKFNESVEPNQHGWWYIKNGKVDFSYNGFAKNHSGWWYCENGKVTFSKNEVTYGVVNGISGWWNVKGSNVKFNESVEPNQHGWWYVKNGKVDFSYTGVKNNEHGWWYIKNGKVIFSYNGFAKNENGWWYLENGKVTFKKHDVIYGTVNGQSGWWNVKGSKVIFNNSVEPNRHGWWYIKNGKVDFSYNGIAANQHGKWYIKNGKVDFSVTGWKTIGGQKYYFLDGKLLSDPNNKMTATSNDLNGKVVFIRSFTEMSYLLEVKGNSLSKGALIQLAGNNEKENNFRKFRLEKQSDGYYKIVPLHSEMAVGVSGDKAVQLINNNDDAIKWKVTTNSDGTYSFISKANGAYLSVGSIKAGVALNVQKSGGDRKFKLEDTAYTQYVSNGCYNIFTGGETKYAFDVSGCKPENRTIVQSWPKNGNPAQLFKIEYMGDGYYMIKTGASIYNSALNVQADKFAAGTNVDQYTADKNDKAQKWRIITDGKKYSFMSSEGRYVINVSNGSFNGGKLTLASYGTVNNNNSFSIARASGFLIRNGRKYYFNKNGAKPMIGLDVSSWSENVDWAAVKSDGIEFAIIRTAHRGGKIDPYGERNMSECERLGIPYGIYYYSTSINEDQADNDVKVMLETVKKHNPKLGLFVDIEASDVYNEAFGSVYSSTARRKITDLTKRMVSKIKAAGYTAGVYANENYMKNVLYMDELPDIRWVAKYFGNNPSDTNIIDLEGKGYKIWQFTDSGTVKGVPNNGYADLNTVIEKYW